MNEDGGTTSVSSPIFQGRDSARPSKLLIRALRGLIQTELTEFSAEST